MTAASLPSAHVASWRSRAARLTFALLIGSAVAACAAPTRTFPSLLPRPAESRSSAEPMPATPAVVADPAIDARAKALTTELRAAAEAFTTLAGRATTLTNQASSAGVGSEAWLSAQSSLAELDALRARTLGALTDLDTLAIERGTAGLPPYPALDAVRSEGEAQALRQSETIEALQSKLPKP